jgi:hypothetical protein
MFFSACGEDNGGKSPVDPGGGGGTGGGGTGGGGTEYLNFSLGIDTTYDEYYAVSGNKTKIQEDNITSITIPATYQGKPVKAILPSGFGSSTESGIHLTNLRSVTIPGSILYIMANAFQYCSGLTSIPLQNVVSINPNAFAYCSSLSSVSLGNSLTSIADNAFRETKLTSISIPNSTTYIGDYAFYNCTSLTSATIGNSAIILRYAFAGCTSLVRVTFAGSGIMFWGAGYSLIFPGDLEQNT